MELILIIVIFLLCIVILILNLFIKIEKANTEYYRNENKKSLNENYELMRKLINKK